MSLNGGALGVAMKAQAVSLALRGSLLVMAGLTASIAVFTPILKLVKSATYSSSMTHCSTLSALVSSRIRSHVSLAPASSRGNAISLNHQVLKYLVLMRKLSGVYRV